MKNLQINHWAYQIIQLLFEKKEDFLSSKDIGKYVALSDRTVRKYIKSLNHMMSDYEATIEMKKGSGYRLQISNTKRFYQLIKELQDQKNDIEDTISLTDNKDRERFILNAILLENKMVTVDDLADMMFISKSTVSTVIQLMKHHLKGYRLNLNYSDEGFVLITGDEIEKRRFILNYFFASSPADTNANIDLFDYQFKDFSTETIFIIVLEQCREFDIQISDFVLQNLVLHIALAIMRNEKGFVIEGLEGDERIEDSKELYVANRIVQQIESLIHIQFTQNEAKYIALHLKSKSNTQIGEDSHQTADNQFLQNQIVNVLQTMKNDGKIIFSLDHQLMMGLKVHFEPLLTRLQLNIQMKNPLCEEIKSRYPEIVDLTIAYFKEMPMLVDFDVSDDEWTYISLHILAAIERYKQENKINVIVICATGLGSAQMLRNRLENEFSTSIHIVNVISYYQLKDEVLKDVDLIISTIDISSSFFNVPVIQVSVFLNATDIDTLSKHLNHRLMNNENHQHSKIISDSDKQLVDQYFNHKRFIVFTQPVDREMILKNLIETLTESNQAVFFEDLVNQIKIREQFGTLAFSDDVAFPHPAQPVGMNSEIAVGIVPGGVVWDQDHQNVRMVILMSPSKIENKGLDMINSGLAELILHQDNIEEIMMHSSFDHFKALLLETINSP